MNDLFRNVLVGLDLSSAGARVAEEPLAPSGLAALDAAGRFARKGPGSTSSPPWTSTRWQSRSCRRRKVRPEAFIRAHERLDGLATRFAAAVCRTTTRAAPGVRRTRCSRT